MAVAEAPLLSHQTPEPAPLQFVPSSVVVWLASLVTILTTFAAGVGVFSQGGPGELAFKTVRGQTVQMFGHGIYRYDTLFQGTINRGTDVVMLAVGVPLLILSIVLYRRGSLRGRLVLLAALAYVGYTYANLALGAAYNDLYLVYVAVFAMSLLASVLVFRSLDLHLTPTSLSPHAPRRRLAIFLFAAGIVTALIWLSDIVPSLVQGQPPKHLDSYTTEVTYTLDLAIITPACLVAGFLVLRRALVGYLLAVPLLSIILLLVPTIVAQTASQLIYGVSLAPGEVIGPVAGFLCLGLVAAWLAVRLLGNFDGSAAGAAMGHSPASTSGATG